MKKITLFILFSILVFTSCKKEPEVSPEDTTADNLPSTFSKKVMLEGYTRYCQFCTPANAKLDSMRNSYKNNSFIPVLISAYHSTQIDYFDSINQFVTVSKFPTASVDRAPAKNAGTQTGEIVFNEEYWTTNIDSELLKTTDFGLKINSSLSGNQLNIDIQVGSHLTTNSKKLSVFILEDGSYYRVLKKVVTYYKGESLQLNSSEITEKSFYNIDLTGIDSSKAYIVAFVHSFNETTSNFYVDNVNEVKIGNNIGW